MSRPTAEFKGALPAVVPEVRLDKWLWAARFYKTRGLAVEAIEAGHVRRLARGDDPQPERVKPSLAVHPGLRLIIQRGEDKRVIDVLALSDRRGSAQVAAALYQETPESLAERERRRLLQAQAAAPEFRFKGRPSKQDRRRLAAFLARHRPEENTP